MKDIENTLLSTIMFYRNIKNIENPLVSIIICIQSIYSMFSCLNYVLAKVDEVRER